MANQTEMEKIQEVIDRGINLQMYKQVAFATIPSSKRNEWYYVQITPSEDYCTCEGWRGWAKRKEHFECKHILAVKELLRQKGFTFKVKKMVYLYSGLTNLDNLMGMGIPLEELILVGGKFQVGKTIFLDQLLYTFVSSYKANCLYLNTEERMVNSFPIWDEAFRKRFKIKEDVKLVNLIVKGSPKYKVDKKTGQKDYTKLLDHTVTASIEPDLIDEEKHVLYEPAIISGFIPSIYDLLALVGHPGRLDVAEDTGYQTFIPLPSTYPFANTTPLGQLIANYHIKFIVVDSISDPVKSVIVFKRGNESARSNCEAALLSRLKEISQIYGCTVMCSAHAIGNSGQYISIKDEGNWGGLIVGHSFKYMLYMRPSPNKILNVDVPNANSMRQVYLRRWATKEDMKKLKGTTKKDDTYEYAMLQLTDQGFVVPKTPVATGKIKKEETKEENGDE